MMVRFETVHTSSNVPMTISIQLGEYPRDFFSPVCLWTEVLWLELMGWKRGSCIARLR